MFSHCVSSPAGLRRIFLFGALFDRRSFRSPFVGSHFLLSFAFVRRLVQAIVSQTGFSSQFVCSHFVAFTVFCFVVVLFAPPFSFVSAILFNRCIFPPAGFVRIVSPFVVRGICCAPPLFRNHFLVVVFRLAGFFVVCVRRVLAVTAFSSPLFGSAVFF